MVRAAIFVCAGYLSGSVLYARVFAGLFKKRDIFEQSSDRNPGTANAFMYGGFWCGLFTLIFDLLKGFFSVFLFARSAADPFSAALVIAAPVVGHIFPLFYRFQGGKGIAVTFGCLAGLYPALDALLILAFFFILFSTVLKITPNFHRTIVAYVISFVAIFFEIRNSAIVLGFLIIAATVLVRLLTSKESRSRLEVKLFGCFNSFVRDRRT